MGTARKQSVTLTALSYYGSSANLLGDKYFNKSSMTIIDVSYHVSSASLFDDGHCIKSTDTKSNL